MRNLLILVLLFLCLSFTLSGATYYVATTGSDNNPGTISSPFATWGKLNSVLVAGDLAYIRGGTYRTTFGASAASHVAWDNLNGTSGSPISIFAYPGESPVLNLDNIASTASSYCMVLYISGCNYLYIKGLRVTGYAQPSSGIPVWGMVVSNSPNCTFEQMTIDNIGGYGVSLLNGSNNILFKNCDVHHCVDRYGNPNGNNKAYEDANGFGVTGGSTATNITYDGCRAWNCSDDGWDFFATDGVYTLNNCWSFWNGYDDSFNALGNGQGFKLGPNASNKSTTLTRTLTNCIAAQNRNNGFDQNTADYSGLMHLYNDAAYLNGGIGFQFSYPQAAGIANVFRNNIAYSNSGSAQTSFNSGTVQSNNTWNNAVTVNNADFAGINVAELKGTRKADGSLPDISLLHLVSGSDLIDAGVNVGLPYSGNAPDMGAFELTSGTTAVIPVYVSSSVENATPSLLEMTYNQALANVAPVASAFSVRVNTIARTVNTVTISGTKVQLTLSSPIVFGDVLTVAYTLPTGNQIQTSLGGIAVTISAQTVSNKVVSAIPVYVSSVIENATPSLLTMTYTLSLANILPSASSFIVQVNGVARSVSSVAISTSTVRLTLASASKFGDIITVSYTKPATNPLQTASGAQAVNVSAKSVTNNITSPTKDLVPFKITMTISPNPVHRNINISFIYTGTFSKLDPATSPQIIRIFDSAGSLKIEKLVETGIAKVRFPINLRAGIYTVVQLSGGVSMSSQKIIVN